MLRERCSCGEQVVDGRVTLPAALVFILADSFLTRVELAGAALLISLLLAIVSPLSPRRLLKVLALAMPFIAVSSISLLFFSGVESAASLLFRTTSAVICLATIFPRGELWELLRTLKHWHMPSTILSLLLLTHRYYMDMGQELRAMRMGLKARGFKGVRNILDRGGLRVLGNLTGSLLLKGLRRSTAVEMGLRARGFRGEFHGGGALRVNLRGVLYNTLAFCGGAGLLLLHFGGGGVL